MARARCGLVGSRRIRRIDSDTVFNALPISAVLHRVVSSRRVHGLVLVQANASNDQKSLSCFFVAGFARDH